MNTTTKERAGPPKVTVALVTEPKGRSPERNEARDQLVRQLRTLEDVELLVLELGALLHDVAHGPAADFVMLTRHAYERLVEDAEDRAATEAHARAAGEERVPLAVVDRLLAGESPIRVWREHRRMTLDQLGAAAGLSKGYLSDLENGKRAGPVETLQAIARALKVGIDDLAPPPPDQD